MSDQRESGKGRATPSRKEAEAARRQAMKQPMGRRERMKRDRESREALRRQQMAALRGQADGANLPPRDRGPVRRFVRDYVDRRLNIAEFLLPILIVVLVLSLIPSTATNPVVSLFWMFTIVATALDEIIMTRGLRKELKERFPDTPTPGTTFYAVLRSTQLRRFRLPTPQIKRGGALPQRYS